MVSAPQSPVLSILVPVYNEARTLLGVLERLRRVGFQRPMEIVVVDDGSTDGSRDLLRNLPDWDNVRVFFHEANGGKGCAVRTALSQAAGDVVVVQDADLELDPDDLPSLLDPILRGETQVCYGSRFLESTAAFRRLPTFWANKTLNALCNWLNGIRLTDMNTCYKMMTRDVALRLDIASRGFAMEPEITTKLARMGVTIRELPVKYHPRPRSEGKKIVMADFFRYVVALVRFRFGITSESAPPCLSATRIR